MRHIIIVGNGISGVTTARHLRKRSDDRITIVSAETDHFFSRTALMYIYMGHMTYEDTKPYEDHFWEENRIELMRGRVSGVNVEGQTIAVEGHGDVAYDELVLATGSASNFFGWPGQDLPGVQGLYGKPDLDRMEASTKGISHGTIVGGGLIGVEMAEMLHSRGIAVSFLVRESGFWRGVLPIEEATLVERHIRERHVDLRMETELDEIVAGDNGRVAAVTTKSGERIDTQFVGLTVGVHPNIGFLEGSGIETDRGILVDRSLRTNAPHVWAAGDCVQHREPPPGRRPVEQVWYTGKIMGEHVAASICGDEREYAPGIWFNSAKFFDLEYQTYGMVPAELPDDQEALVWEDPEGERLFRMNYKKDGLAVTGFNLFGLRGRHVVAEEWIRTGTTAPEVVQQLGSFNFDPEFFARFEPQVHAMAKERFPDLGPLQLEKGLASQILRRLVGGKGVRS